MRVLITGSSGFIGSALKQALRGKGHRSVSLVRRAPRSQDEAAWNPDDGTIDTHSLEGADAAIHLAGVGIGSRRWTAPHKLRVMESRSRGTRLLSEALAGLDPPPEALLCASAVGYYGDRGEEKLTEESHGGAGFLSDVCRRWEAAADPARAAGIRVVHLRSGLVLDRSGGVFPLQSIPFRLGMGGRIGSGRQFWSWITLRDEVRAMMHLLEARDVSGPVNLTAPTPVTNADFTRTLGRVLHRPTVFTVPELVVRLALGGEMANELLLFSQRVLPKKLQASGFTWLDADLEAALRRLFATTT